jgi:hypothetical protein
MNFFNGTIDELRIYAYFEEAVIPPEDTFPPKIVNTIPTQGEVNVSIYTDIRAVFNECLASVNMTITDEELTKVEGNVSFNTTTYTAVFKPHSPLAYDTKYSVTILAEETYDLAGNRLAENFSWYFTTEPAPVEPQPPFRETEEVIDGYRIKVNYTGEGTVNISASDCPPDAELPEGLMYLGIFVNITAVGEVYDINITIFYRESDLPEVINESTLRLYFWDDSSNEWRMVIPSGVDTERNIVWGIVSHLTIFTAMGNKARMPAEEGAKKEEPLLPIELIVIVSLIVVVVIIIIVVAIKAHVRKKKRRLEEEKISVEEVPPPIAPTAPPEAPPEETPPPPPEVPEAPPAQPPEPPTPPPSAPPTPPEEGVKKEEPLAEPAREEPALAEERKEEVPEEKEPAPGEAPEVPVAPVPTEPEPGEERVCSACGGKLEYIKDYDSWYCYACEKYEGF